MPSPDILVIDVRPDGIFLLRYTVDGAFGGDTWHASAEAARSQADYEHGSEIEWLPIPEHEVDAVAYAVRAARSEAHRP